MLHNHLRRTKYMTTMEKMEEAMNKISTVRIIGYLFLSITLIFAVYASIKQLEVLQNGQTETRQMLTDKLISSDSNETVPKKIKAFFKKPWKCFQDFKAKTIRLEAEAERLEEKAKRFEEEAKRADSEAKRLKKEAKREAWLEYCHLQNQWKDCAVELHSKKKELDKQIRNFEEDLKEVRIGSRQLVIRYNSKSDKSLDYLAGCRLKNELDKHMRDKHKEFNRRKTTDGDIIYT